MLRGAPPAAGPTGTVPPWAVRGPRRSCTALYEAAPSAVGPTGTTGRGRAAEWTYTSTHAHLGTAGRETRKGTVGCGRAGGAA